MHQSEAKNIVVVTGVVALIGAFLMVFLIQEPVVSNQKECKVYKVATEVRTAYVLKPPPAPAPERIIVKEECKIPVEKERVEETETTEKCEQVKPRRKYANHRNRRHRRRWIWK
jgi:hypothetical protein